MELSNINVFKITDDKSSLTYYGCDQAWYDNIWKKKAGCGPCTVCNIIIYLYYKTLFNNSFHINKTDVLRLMNEIWEYVTPSVWGVNSTKMLYDGAIDYAVSKGMDLNYNYLNIPQDRAMRPELDEVIDFIAKAIKKDSPVAFLNLCNGEEKNLYRWHWVTIAAINVKSADEAILTVLDEGKIIYINLSLWYKTTNLGGGFVFFYK